MLFARPPGGFHVTEVPAVTRRIRDACERWPALAHAWVALKARLALVGHREGTPLPGEGAGHYVIRIDSLDLPGQPELTAPYQLLGEDLVIRSVLVMPVT